MEFIVRYVRDAASNAKMGDGTLPSNAVDFMRQDFARLHPRTVGQEASSRLSKMLYRNTAAKLAEQLNELADYIAQNATGADPKPQ